ncbi:FAD binding domain-containing protein [Mycena epipterygia]|nr:FAD binding domain-containing protein [Mycena epipterygia]
MTVSTPSYTDVLIIGAGPGGLMAAQALAKLGIQVKIIDRRGVNDKYGNADGLMSRTLEIWQSYGLLERIAPKACPVHVGYEQCGDGIVRSVPCTNVVVPARYQYDLGVAPEIIEAVLRESLAETGHHVSQRLAPAYMTRDDSTDGLVKIILQRLPADLKQDAKTIPNGHNGFAPDADNVETVFAKYVIGADGAHSWVRRHLNIPMEGDQTEYFWGAADVAVKTNFPDFRSKCVIQAATGAVIIIPREEDKIRIYVQFSPHEATRSEDGRLAIPIDVAANMVLEKAELGLKPYAIEFTQVFWCTLFTVSQMVAAKYSVDDRIFIIGDACHTHSPKAGQGANAAIGDAHNLGWKIAHVLRNWAKPSLLHTYEVERRRYAQDLIAFDKVIAESLDGGTAADYQSLLHQQNMFTSGIGIHYKSMLVIDSTLPMGATHLEAGYRLPPVGLDRLADWRPQELQQLAPSDGLFKLFLFPGDLLCGEDAKRLDMFCSTLSSSLGMAEMLGVRVQTYTILNSDKKKAMWTDVPDILRDWKRVFVAKSAPENAYSKFGVSSEGAAVLVRPDGHISLAPILSSAAAKEISIFFANL